MIPEVFNKRGPMRRASRAAVFPPARMNAAASSVAGLLLYFKHPSRPDLLGLVPEPLASNANPTRRLSLT